MALLVPPCDHRALSEAILRCGHDPALRSRLGNNARRVFESHYTEKRMLNAYRQLYLSRLRMKCPPLTRSSVMPKVRVIPRVRRAKETDLPGIVAIHRAAFSDFFLTKLGPAFLYRYYKLVLGYRSGILLVSEGSGAMLAASSSHSESGGSRRPAGDAAANPRARSARSSTSAAMRGATESWAPAEPTT